MSRVLPPAGEFDTYPSGSVAALLKDRASFIIGPMRSVFHDSHAAGRSAIAALCLFLAVSCSLKQEILLKPDGSGSATFSAQVNEDFMKKMKSLQSFGDEKGSASSEPFFQAEDIKAQLAENKDISVKYVTTIGKNGVEGEIAFKDFDKAFSSASKGVKAANAFTLTRSGKNATFKFSLSRSNAAALYALFPGIDKDLMELLAPPALDPEPITEAEYLTIFASSGTNLVPIIKAAAYELTITPNGKISSQTGGTVKGNSVTFVVPILKLLVLEKPINLMVSWKEN
jgi:hypothetical protein